MHLTKINPWLVLKASLVPAEAEARFYTFKIRHVGSMVYGVYVHGPATPSFCPSLQSTMEELEGNMVLPFI